MEKKLEQLIILGNGFDLACELKSKYEHFYKSRYKDYYTSDIKACYDFFNGSFIASNRFDEFSEKPFLKINVWDFIFFIYEDVMQNTWTDIEQTIRKHLEGLYYACLYRSEDYSGWSRDMDEDFINNTKSWYEYYKPVVELMCCRLKEQVYSFSEDKLNEQEELKTRWSAYKKQILKELNDFEGHFVDYLNGATNFLIYQKSVNRLFSEIIRRYDENGTSQHAPLNGLTTNVLSFNYTEVETFDKQKKIPLNEYRNVHGKLSRARDGIIFGIDLQELKKNDVDKDFNSQDLFLEFTKTFRTLQMASKFGTNKLYSKETKQIKFYGHGLGEADYSYFMSIFDAVELYSGETTLVFFYNPELLNEEEKQFRRVSDLILKYAETLKSENHGDNLLHKLILENRIKILPLKFTPSK